jgi:hypothetical protein
MKSRFLFPYWTRFLGIAMILIHVVFAAFWGVHDKNYNASSENDGFFSSPHLFFMATTLMMTVGLFLVAFSKEIIEDEQISQLRLDSLLWAVYLNYLVLITSLVFFRHAEIKHILELNLWVPLIFFIIRFRWINFRLNRSLK